MKKVILALSIFAFGITSCKKDNTPEPTSVVYAEENPTPSFLTTTGLSQVSSAASTPLFYERGFSFKSAVDGKINSLIIKLPNDVPLLRVTIWDNNLGTILRTENATNLVANTESIIAIPSFSIAKNKEYLISMNSKSFYTKRRADNADVQYPKTIGNISVLGVAYLGTPAQTFPSNPVYNYFYGDIGFNFQQTN